MNLDIVEETYKEIVQRHEILRTVVKVIDGEPRQFVKSMNDFTFRINLLEASSESDYNTIYENEINTHFDLTESSIRASYVKDHECKINFLIVFHHIIIDAWSLGLLQKEFQEIYQVKSNGSFSNLLALSIQYKDYDRGPDSRRLSLFKQKYANILLKNEFTHWASEINESDKNRIKELVLHNIHILGDHKLQGKINCNLIAIEASKNQNRANMSKWKSFTNGEFTQYYIETTHYGILTEQKQVLSNYILENI